MRIIAGSLGGRHFDAPSGHRTHPMSEKARGGLFNTLGDIKGLSILDAFAGSGALSFEAVSRGAASAVAIETDRHAHGTIVKSVIALGLQDDVKAVRANVSGWLVNNPDAGFDVVLADPPYDNLQPKLLERLANHVKTNGVIVYSLPPDTSFALPVTNYQLLATKSYGDAQLVIYRRIS